jgi:hypothetical protein
MKAIIKFLTWLAANMLLLYAFLIALLIHVSLIAALGWIKIGANHPRIVASFDASVLPPPAADKDAQAPNAGSHDFDYSGSILGSGGGTMGKGPGGVPTAGGGTPESYLAHLATPSAQIGQESLADVIGVVSDGAMAIARPEGGPSGVSLTVPGGLGDTTIGTAGIKGPGGGIFGARMGPQRASNLNKYDGNSETERAVTAGLRWLKAHQEANGSWKCGASSAAGTALATLAFLGHGETPDSVEFGETVSRALDYLSLHVGSDGLVSDESQDYIGGDSQGLVTLALTEGYAMTQSPVLRDTVERALNVIIRGQSAVKANTQHVGGWRYHPTSDDSDVSVTGWMIMTLTSARAAGMPVPKEVCDKAAQFLWNMYDAKDPGFGYQTPERSPSMTAIGVFCQQLLGNGKDPRIKAALDYLREQRVEWDKTEGDYVLYGWYYITQAMFQGGGAYWEYWNREIRDTLIKKQRSDGRWMPPSNSTMETRELAATPAYSTALGTLILEVYYRYSSMEQLTQQGTTTTAAPNQGH